MKNMKLKKFIFISMLIITIFSFPVLSSAEQYSASEPQTEASTEPTTIAAEDATCICGRPYHTSDGKGYLKYDCVKCKKNYLLCICDCWCGHDTYTEETAAGTIKYCSGCKRSCIDCICADKSEMLLREQQLSNGSFSPMGFNKPVTAIAIVFATIFLAIFLFIGAYGYVATKGADTTEEKEKQKLERKQQRPRENQTATTVKWPIKGKLPAIAAYEITVENITKRTVKETSEPFSDFDPVKLTTPDISMLADLVKIPLKEISTVKISENKTSGENLVSLGFVELTKIGTLRLTEEGKAFAETLFTPENFMTFGKKTDRIYHICQKGEVRILYTENRNGSEFGKKLSYGEKPSHGINLSHNDRSSNDGTSHSVSSGRDNKSGRGDEYEIIDYLDKKAITTLIKNRLIVFDKGQNDTEPLNTKLSYDEWYLLMICINRKENIFTLSHLKDREKIKQLKTALGRMLLPMQAAALDNLFKNDEKLAKALASLLKKGFIAKNADRLSMTPITIRWLAPHDLSDTVFFNNKDTSGLDYTMLFIQKRAGTTCIYDNGEEVRLMSSSSIPWSVYIK